jgi:hypothetical protein
VHAAFPGATETPDLQARLLGYSYGPGYKRTVATLILSKTGVKIGIPYKLYFVWLPEALSRAVPDTDCSVIL